MRLYKEISREEFKDFINWEFWDKLVSKTRDEIKDVPSKEVDNVKKIYLYNKYGELVTTFKHITYCRRYLCDMYQLEISNATVANYIKKEWNIKNNILSYNKLRKDEAFAMFKYNVAHGHQYFGKTSSKKIPLYTYNSSGELVGVFDSKKRWALAHKKSISFTKNERVYQDRLISTNNYDKDTARKKYEELSQKV